ncbi:hypothetical protein [Mucilaginibacter conchicola]|uniref:hypothetical protein n=1 Tax=Mucilaginibacter conchicola TaxID=2303333 RepID=UPI001F2606BC|nr:hypothetical protein [Mucilaginibacter conchicola]
MYANTAMEMINSAIMMCQIFSNQSIDLKKNLQQTSNASKRAMVIIFVIVFTTIGNGDASGIVNYLTN